MASGAGERVDGGDRCGGCYADPAHDHFFDCPTRIADLEADCGRLRAAVREAGSLVEGALEPGALGRPVRGLTRGELADLEAAVRVLAEAMS